MKSKLNIDLIVVGSLKEKSLKSLSDEYAKRISAYSKLEIKELKDENNNLGKDMVLEKEKEKILKVIDKNSYIIIMDIDGKQCDSEQFAEKFINIATFHNSKVTFVIGGSHGLHSEIKNMANEKISFSKMTFPHQLFRIMLLEQSYRAFRINNNSPYHK